MSSPYVYQPSSQPYPNQYQQTPYYYTPRSSTPFIPDASLYPSSPYSNHASLPGSPNHGASSAPLPHSPNTPNRYPFPTTNYEINYAPSWDPYQRTRRPSWHGVNDDQWLQAPPTYPIGAGYNRRHSFGATGYQAAPPFSNWSQFQGGVLSPNTVFTQSQFHINPWLNAESPRGDFFFDLSTTVFSPMRLFGQGQAAPLGMDEMGQPATHPPLTRLRIICDLTPHWPIDLQLNYAGAGISPNPYQPNVYQPPPISLLDVLIAIHRAMHKRISHVDWAKLNTQEEIAVSRAYTKRCKAMPSTAEHELAQGVKRVDYLLGKTRMIGLVRVGTSDGIETMKLHLT